MNDFVNKVFRHAMGALRYRGPALIVAWLLFVGGAIVIYLLPPVYEARAQVYIDTDLTLRPLLQGLAVQADVASRVALMTQALLSQRNLRKVARSTGFDLLADSEIARERLLDELSARIGIFSGVEENLYTITFSDPDRVMALNIVDNLLNTLVEDTVDASQLNTTNAQGFLETQIQVYEQRLAAAEQRLADFKRQNVGKMPGEGGDYYSALQTAMNEQDSVQTSLKAAKTRRQALQRQIEGEEPVFGVLDGGASTGGARSALSQRIQQYEQELDSLLLQYTDRHPDVLALRSTISQLRAQEQGELKLLGIVDEPVILERNPIYQRLRMDLNQTEVTIADLQSSLVAKTQAVDDLRAMLDAIPEVEAQLTRLNRDYNVIKNQYDILLARFEAAKLSQEADKSTDDITFRIVDPPAAPLEPVGPNRPVLLTAILILSIAAGGGLAVLLSDRQTLISTTDDLAHYLQRPVLGSISLIHTAAYREAHKFTAFVHAGALTLLLLTFVVAIYFHSYAPQLVAGIVAAKKAL
jgi:polysaccharide chain length determinant protein (PEP-CTERM system associated)